jgi:hypothetical protein
LLLLSLVVPLELIEGLDHCLHQLVFVARSYSICELLLALLV